MRTLQSQAFVFKQETQEVPLPVELYDSLHCSSSLLQLAPGSRAPPVLTAVSGNKRWKGPLLLDSGLCLGYERVRPQLKEHLSPWRKGTAFRARIRCFPITRANRATAHPAEAKSHLFTLPPQAPQRAEPLHRTRCWLCQIKTWHVWKPWRRAKHALYCQLPTAHNLFNQRQRHRGSTCKTFLKK